MRHRGLAAGELSELRLGAGELSRAYEHAVAEGFEPLAVGLAAVADHAARLRQAATDAAAAGEPGLPDWMTTYLARLSALPNDADPSAFGRQRETFKNQWRDIVPAMTAAVALARGVSGWERVVSERVLGHSKRLGELRHLVAAILARADPQWEGVELPEPVDLLEYYGLRRKPGLIRCAGMATLRIGSRLYALEDFSPTAHIPGEWTRPWIDGLKERGVRLVTTVENEYPFLSYVEESGGPRGLGARNEVAVYVAGFPTPALLATLAAIGSVDGVEFRHWGDADVGGLRIWWTLRRAIRRPVGLFRTTSEWVERESRRGGTPLGAAERRALRAQAARLRALADDALDVCDAVMLIDALLRLGIKLEQERRVQWPLDSPQ